MSDNPRPLVLVIDPDPKTATSLLPLLVAEGYRAASCSAIARSLSAVQRRRPDLVLVSKEVENCDGMIQIGKIKEMSPDTRAILLIESGDWPSVLDAIDAGADDLHHKRSGAESLLRSVRRLLDPGQAPSAVRSFALHAR